MSIQVEVWGHDALFTRPEMKTERVSYDVITPSAARGIIESIYFHPGLRWVIDRIYVLSPIRFSNLRRNEVKSKISAANALSIANGTSKTPYLVTANDIQQRAAMLLLDVHYVIEAHFVMTDKAGPSDNPGKFQDITKRRLRRGQCYSQPYLGCRECTAQVRLWEGGDIPAIEETRDLGYMLYDMDYSNLQDIQPMFFRAQMVNGVIDLRDCEVIR
ncbi:MAG: type I-C CRISPR-associated protein Cas5 [Clostridia bacterium]|nr:type I-C CRISPR-associated protein Cas5 [Clostridia bacterium]